MKKKLGQYFTKNESLKEELYKMILNKPQVILEPSIGRGDLIDYVIKRINVIFDMYEVDNSIKLLDSIKKNEIIYKDFLKEEINKKYKTIIGNPPYIKTKKGNLYVDFIKKCYNLLDNNGELIFIIPSDFFKLTCSYKLLNEMLNNGSITNIYHPHKENLFEEANIDVLIFRYCKNKNLEKKVLYNGILLNIINSNGLITFSDKCYLNDKLISNYFDIYVGMVSGKDEVYKNNDLGNIYILNGEKKKNKYIYIKEYPCDDKEINEYLLKNKDKLINRKIKKFNDKNWFEWGAPRNISIMEKYKNGNCIYIYNLTRKEKVAFRGKIEYFGGNLLMMKPKIDINLDDVEKYLNSYEFRNKFIFSGRFKIGHRQLSNSYITL